MWKHTTTGRKGEKFEFAQSYPVEHLATFRVGPQFGVQWPEDGLKKLKDMERSSEIWAQRMVLKFRGDFLVFEDENGEIIEKFPKQLVGEPRHFNALPYQALQQRDRTSANATAAGASLKTDDKNLLTFNVSEEGGVGAGFRAEMHIFRCTNKPASEVVDAVKSYLSGRTETSLPSASNGQPSSRIIPVRLATSDASSATLRPNGNGGGTTAAAQVGGWSSATAASSRYRHRAAHHRGHSESVEDTAAPVASGSSAAAWYHHRPPLRTDYADDDGGGGTPMASRRRGPGSAAIEQETAERRRRWAAECRDAGNGLMTMSRSYSDYPIGSAFDSDVNALNCYIDDVEHFVSRVQAVGAAQRELDNLVRQHRDVTLRTSQQQRYRHQTLPPPPPLVVDPALQSRAQWPSEADFVDILTKFKYCFNLLGKIQHNIYDPDAPQLARYLFSPLLIVLDAARFALNKDLAPQITYPILTPEANLLLQEHLSRREYELWLSLGDAWRNRATHFLPTTTSSPRRPADFYPPGPYRGPAVADTLPRGFSTSDIDRIRSQEELEAEARQLAEKERILREKELLLEKMEQKLNQDKESVRDAFERISLDQPPGKSADHFPYPADQIPSSSGSRQLTGTSRSQPSQRTGQPMPFLSENGGTKGSAPAVTLFQRQHLYLDKLKRKGVEKIIYVTHDRIGQNDKELTVSRGDYLEVLNDSRNWWQCRDANGTVGFVPHTILSVLGPVHTTAPAPPSVTFQADDDLSRLQKPITVAVPPHTAPIFLPPPPLPPPSGVIVDPANHFYQPKDRRPVARNQGPDRTILRNGRY